MTDAVGFVVGPAGHGVVRHARLLAAAAGWAVVDRVEQVQRDGWVVLDVTDRLWGRTSDVSGPAVNGVLDDLRARGARVAVALHDVPFAGDGPVFERRASVYRGIVQRSDAVFVCSEVERRRLIALVPTVTALAVLPLPVPDRRPRPAGGLPAAPRSVTVLGYLYPGKGHEQVLTAMTGLPADIPMVCVGRPSDGHDDLVRVLTATDRPVHVTGFVPDANLATWLQAATVPVAPNRVVSASGSIATWWAYGRRPLVPDIGYTREIGAGDMLDFYDDDLAGSLQRAFESPASTWLADGVTPGPSLEDVAAARDAWLRRWSA